MTLGALFGLSGGGLFVLLSLLEVSKIKINPWSWLLGHIGKKLNRDVMNAVSATQKDVAALTIRFNEAEAKREQARASQCRNQILRFGDECSRHINHSKEYFDQILEDISCYKAYCQRHPQFPNSKAEANIELIYATYKECLKDDSFLRATESTK